MAGDAARAIAEIESQHEAGGDPHDDPHRSRRFRALGDAAQGGDGRPSRDTSRTEAEKTRGADYAQRIGMAHLSRAWQMLLKGITETELHADPLMAAEMVLIRLAYAADLPAGEDLAKLAQPGRNAPSACVPLPPPRCRERDGRRLRLQAARWR